MKNHPIRGANEEKAKRFFATFVQQWDAFLAPSRMNWIDFTFVKVEFEFAKYTGRIELELWLFGLGLLLTYIFDDTFNRKMEARVAEIKANPKLADEILDGLSQGKRDVP